MIIILMGVSGCGKSAVGKVLAEKLNIPFFDADDYHPEENKKKMAANIPLNDEDRFPWLKRLAQLMRDEGEMVLACSALKASYREILRISSDVFFVYLKGNATFIRNRLKKRQRHFFKEELLNSQFRDLEEPREALTVSVKQTIPEIVAYILHHLPTIPN